MPDFGISRGAARALRRAARRGAKEARVRRQGEEALKEVPDEAIPDRVPEPVDDPPAPTPGPEPEPVATPRPADLGASPDADPARPRQQEPSQPARVEPEEPPVATLDPEQPAARPRSEEPELPDVDADVEAARLSQARLGDYSLDETFQTNFDTINTTDEIKAVIADVSQQNAGRIDEARRGTITNDQLRGLSEDLDINEDVVRAVMERETGGILNAETILAARQVVNSSAERIKSIADQINTGQATDMDKLKFRRQLQWHREFQTQFMGARAEAGRALNAFRIPAGADVDVGRIRELVDNANGWDTDRVAAAVGLMDNPTSISQASRKYTQSKLMGAINELFINSILSGPKTHLVNTSGNILMQAANIAETAVAARIGRFLGGEEHAMVGEASALMHGTISAWRDGLRIASRTMKTGIALDDVVKFEQTRRRSISAEHLLTPKQRNTHLGRFAEGLLDGVRIPVGGRQIPVPGIGPVIRSPTERVMAPTDEFFKTLAYRAELERQAFLHAHEQVASGAARAEDAAKIVREFMEDAPVTAVKAAEDYTRYTTFQNPLGEFGTATQLWLRKAPVLSLLAPFVRTPVNLFKAGIMDRSPVALFRPKFYQAMKAGGRERDMMLARVGMGTATSAVVASYVTDGTITGAGPGNPQARALLEASGWQPYSIRVGDKYYSYSRMEPFAFVIGATADAVETLSYINSDVEGLDTERERVNEAIAAVIVGIANNTMSKTYVQGIADFTEMMSDPARYFRGWSQSMSSAMVPFSAFRSQVGQIDDPYLREAWTILDNLKVRSGIPGWSEEAPPRRDIFGEPRQVYSGDLLGPMSPLPDREIRKDPVLDEAISLMELTRDVPLSMPGKRIEGMRLDANEYDQLVTISRTEPLPSTGRTFHDELLQLMSRPAYLNATADMQVELIKDVQSRYDAAARVILEERDPLYAARIANFRQRRRELRFGE